MPMVYYFPKKYLFEWGSNSLSGRQLLHPRAARHDRSGGQFLSNARFCGLPGYLLRGPPDELHLRQRQSLGGGFGSCKSFSAANEVPGDALQVHGWIDATAGRAGRRTRSWRRCHGKVSVTYSSKTLDSWSHAITHLQVHPSGCPCQEAARARA